MQDGTGDRFQQETKYFRDRMSGGGMDYAAQPDVYKEYPTLPEVELPKRVEVEGMSLNDVLNKRRSVREYSAMPISIEQLSYLLWASGGIQREEMGWHFRTAPSAGALYPIETYLVINNVRDVERGIYHYNVRRHSLETLKTGDFRDDIARAALGQSMCADCAVVFVWTAIFQRSKWKYKQRAYRYIYLDAGHIAENLALAATASKLGTCQVAALFDDEVNTLLEIDGNEESVVYMSTVGVPA